MLGLWVMWCGLPLEAAPARPEFTETIIRSKGSDTLLPIISRWATRYQSETPAVALEASGGGSGNGIAALINGHVELAATSRPLRQHEIKQAVKRAGQHPMLHPVGMDALSIVVHPNNPLHGLSLKQLANIYMRDGKIERWSDLGVQVAGCDEQEILRIGRKNNSGSYFQFREEVMERGQHFHAQLERATSSEAVVQRVANAPCAIGYVGMGFVTSAVKTLCVSKEKGACIPPTAAHTLEKRYPLARYLYLVTLGEPSEAVKKYLNWILGPVGQEMLQKTGFIPMPKGNRGAVLKEQF
ncbi:MAG: phosphate ABC transporter substrate-binding protein [Magnetococcales bacterium]|nr:phosphate ABC transporter substrate-binding protein [Magnetococcales bacterium]MBF0113704.1 phosphate ABC transporter substrate-binding protein [Magnetococcales bacterium]